MKFLKKLFTVPEGEPVTDRHLKRVLISSVCGILLCMTCLLSTTWAWYTVTIESEPIEITVASHSVSVKVMNGTAIPDEKNAVDITKEADVAVELQFNTDATANEMNPNPGRYIVLAVYVGNEYKGSYYVQAVKTQDSKNWTANLTLQTGENCTVNFSSSWQIPLNAVEVENGAQLVLIPKAEPKTESTESTGTVENTTESVPQNTETTTETTQPSVPDTTETTGTN